LRDRELIRDVARWIAERLAESSLEPVEAIWEGLQDSIPGARAIAAYLGDISHPTVQGIWSNQAALYGDKYPWLLETKLIGLDGLGYEVEARPAIPAAPSDAPASNKVVNLPVVQPIAPPPKTATAPDPKPRSENSSTTEAAPTDSAPIAPIQTYTGEARKHRVRELAEKFAGEIVLTLAPEMQLSLTITEICENLVVAITDELMVGVGLLTIGVVDRE
jgi:hypothetical protein